MPLIKSKKPFEKSTEMPATSGPKDLSVALGVKRKTMKKPIKKMADGGSVKDEIDYSGRPNSGYGAIIFKAEGGEVEKPTSVASAIMSRRKMMAEGGMVDLEENNMEDPADLDDLNEAALKENYDADLEDVTQPMDSNEHSDDIDSDKHDMISAIRAKLSAKRMFR